MVLLLREGFQPLGFLGNDDSDKEAAFLARQQSCWLSLPAKRRFTYFKQVNLDRLIVSFQFLALTTPLDLNSSSLPLDEQ